MFAWNIHRQTAHNNTVSHLPLYSNVRAGSDVTADAVSESVDCTTLDAISCTQYQIISAHTNQVCIHVPVHSFLRTHCIDPSDV